MDVFGGVVGRSDAPRRRQYCARMVSIIRCEILATLNCLSVQSVQESEDAKARMHDAQIYLFGAEGQAHYEIGLWFSWPKSSVLCGIWRMLNSHIWRMLLLWSHLVSKLAVTRCKHMPLLDNTNYHAVQRWSASWL